MSNDEDLFDFNETAVSAEDLSEKFDSSAVSSDTTEKVAKKPSSKTTGKSSGSKSGGVSRQQKRVPMHQRQPLNVDNRDPKFEYRVVNDTPGRVARLELAGWVVDESTTIGDRIAGRATSMGSATTAPVGKGTTGVVMKIPKELYDEDQRAKQLEVDKSEKAMFADAEDTVKQAAGTVHGGIRTN